MAVGEKEMPGRRVRKSKTNTIHSCAQSGDLSGLQKRLEENPSLLNAKNDISSAVVADVAMEEEESTRGNKPKNSSENGDLLMGLLWADA